jgi:hypothetical protein
LEPLIELLDDPEAAEGMEFIRALHQFCAENGETEVSDLDFLGECGAGPPPYRSKPRGYSRKTIGRADTCWMLRAKSNEKELLTAKRDWTIRQAKSLTS